MNINFTARHTNITPDIKKYCERRLKSVEKKLGYEVDADIILSVEKYRNIAEINIKTKGATLNFVEETDDMRSSLDAAFDHLDRRIRKEKEKWREKARRKGKMPEVFIPASPAGESQERKKVIRSQDYSMKPMSVDEAVLQLESEKRKILMFRRYDSEKWAAVYLREDGHIGLIDPD